MVEQVAPPKEDSVFSKQANDPGVVETHVSLCLLFLLLGMELAPLRI